MASPPVPNGVGVGPRPAFIGAPAAAGEPASVTQCRGTRKFTPTITVFGPDEDCHEPRATSRHDP
jgi:hypothetical protein